MAISVALAIIFPYVDYNDPSRNSSNQQTSTIKGDSELSQDVKESSVDGSIGNHQPNLFDNKGNINEDPTTSSASSLQNAANDASSGKQTTIIETSSCHSLLILADGDSNGMMDSIEYRNFIDDLKVADYLTAKSSMAGSMANFDFGAYSSTSDGLPISLKLKFLSLSSSSSEYCIDGESTTATVICIGGNKESTSSGGSSSNNKNGVLDYICEETMKVMEEIVRGVM